jgi:hypothetical protein
MNPVPICEKVPFREALVHPLSAAFTAGAMPRANTIAPAIARVFAVLLCFRIVAFVGLFREETVLRDLLPPLQAEADVQSGHVCAIFFGPAGGGLSISTRPQEITGLLRAWRGGDEAALARLAERVYPELRMIARRYMKNERQANTLQTTALVHEVYVRLVDVTQVEWHERAQFFAMAAQMMRRILVDAARARGAHKRGGGGLKVNLDETALLIDHAGRIYTGPG